jgi:hypothetical protein
VSLRSSWAPRAIHLDTKKAPLALCSPSGEVQTATSHALELLQRLSWIETLPAPCSRALGQAREAAAGEALRELERVERVADGENATQ